MAKYLYILTTSLNQVETGESTLSFFNLRALTGPEIIFYIGVLLITGGAISYLVWQTQKKRKNFFKDSDLPVETIKLHVKTEAERKKAAKYEREVEDFLAKKRYIKGRK